MPENRKLKRYRAASEGKLRLKKPGFKSPKHDTRALHEQGEENRARQQFFATLLLILMASAAPPATKPVVHSFPSDLVEAEAAQRAKEEIRRKVEAELVAALTSLETAKNAKWVGGASDKENSEPGASDTKLKEELARTKEELNGCRFLLRDAQNALAEEAAKTEAANKDAQRWEGEASKLRDELASVKDELDKARVATAAAQGFVKRHQEMQRQQQEATEMMRRAEELKLAMESQAVAVEPPVAAEPSAPAVDGENIGHPPPPPRSPARPTPKAGEDAFPKVDVEKVKLARQVAKQTQEALRAQEAAIAQINQLLVENAKLGKELAEERKKTGALENIGQDIFKGWWG